MILTDIRLQNYRSYQDDSFELGAGVNIVVGPNAAGKTNLLEALIVVTGGKSYRARDPLLLKQDAAWARIDVHTDQNQSRVVKIQQSPTGLLTKTFEIDDKVYKRLTNSFRYPVVLFEPNALFLLQDEPSARREYMDDLIEQFTPGYSTLRSSYRRVVAQRNALLKHGSHGASQLFAWDIRLCDLGSQLVTARLELINHINQQVQTIYQSIAERDSTVSVRYESKTNTQNYSSHLMNQLESTRSHDLERGFTGHGPHRDDMVIYFGDKPAAQCASRGEVRTLLLSLKILELKILEEKTGHRPLLLLDDVFSELDGARRRALTDYLSDYQTVITTTDADVILKDFKTTPTIIPIAQ